MSSTVIRVTNATELNAALAAAQGGETIVLAEGDYGTLEIKGRDFAETVTLVSETPLAASLSELRVEKSSNLTFDGFFMDYEDVETSCHFSVKKSSDITIRNSHFEGTNLDKPGAVNDGYPLGRALNIKNCENVLLENNEFSTFWKAMGISLSEGVVVRGNEIHDIRSDGINVTRSDGVLIENNHIHDFRLNPESGDHADMIQIYSYKTGIVPRNIEITGNYLDIGEGRPTHGIFFNHAEWIVNKRAENGLETYFENISITDNVLVGGHVHGIAMAKADGVLIANNTLVSQPGSDLNEPRLTVNPENTNVTVTGNMAKIIRAEPNDPSQNWVVENNALIQYDDPNTPNYYGDIFVNGLSDVTNAPKNLLILPDSALSVAGIGSSQLRYDNSPETLIALARPETGAVLNEVIFDAGYSAGPDGAAIALGASFHWDFGDGNSAWGVVATHRYLAPGTYTAVLTVTLPDGTQDVSEVITVIEGFDLLSYDATSDLLVLSLDGQQVFLDLDGAQDIEPAPSPDLFFAAEQTTTLAFGAPAPQAAPLPLEAPIPQSLTLANDVSLTLPSAARGRFEGADDFDITLAIAATGAGSILTSKGTFSVQIMQNGDLQFSVNGDKLTTTGIDFLDGQFHQVGLHYDGADGLLSIVVDGQIFDKAIEIGEIDNLRSDIKIGAASKSGGVPVGGATAEITMLEIDVNADSYDMSPPPVSGALEVGTLAVNQLKGSQWHSVSFETTIEDAHVVMGPLSFNGHETAAVRVQNVTDQGFEFQIEEFDGNGRHTLESLSWIAASAGTHTLATGETVMVGRTQAEDYDPVEVSFGNSYDSSTLTVFTQVTSHNGDQTVSSRVEEVGSSGFSVYMQESEKRTDGHVPESIDWIALETGDTFHFQAMDLTDSAQKLAETEGELAVLAAMQTANDRDTAVLRLIETDAGVEIFIQEDMSADAEQTHAAEAVHVMQIENGSYDLFV